MHFTGNKYMPFDKKKCLVLPNIPSEKNNLIKFTHFDETKKRAHDLQIVFFTYILHSVNTFCRRLFIDKVLFSWNYEYAFEWNEVKKNFISSQISQKVYESR